MGCRLTLRDQPMASVVDVPMGKLVEIEPRCQERRVELKPSQILHSLVGLVCSSFLVPLRHDLSIHLQLGNCTRQITNVLSQLRNGGLELIAPRTT